MKALRPALRRADWRFLLPAAAGGQFRHLVLLGAPPGLAERLAETGTAAQVTTTLPPRGRADALVLLAGAGTGLRDAAPCLADDGVLYWEVERRLVGGLSRGRLAVSRQLREAGLEHVATYWVSPNFGDARQYVPLDAPEVLAWFFKTRFLASSLLAWLLKRVVGVTPRGGASALRAIAPCCAVTATARGREVRAPTLLAGACLRGSPPDRQARVVMFTSGRDDGGRIVALPFSPNASRPDFVLKRARLPGFTAHIAREQATLAEVRGIVGPELRDTLPEPLGLVGPASNPLFAETSVGGQMLSASTGKWRASAACQVRDLRLAAGWLAAFHREGQVRKCTWTSDDIERWVDRPFARFAAVFGAAEAESRLFDLGRARARTLIGGRLPVVWVHNDFTPWHLYRDGDHVSVIDWEFGKESLGARQGLPLCDLIYFLSHWLHLARGLPGEEAQVRNLTDFLLGARGRDWRIDSAADVLATYMREIGLRRAFFPLFLVCTWVDRALDRQDRKQSLGSAEACPQARRADNLFVRYVEALAGVADRLFTEAPHEETERP